MEAHIFASLSIWLTQALYAGAMIPQIIMNYRRKSTKGISDFMLIGLIIGYIFYCIYIFTLNLPLPYKIFVPLQCLGALTLVIQRFYYTTASFELRRIYAGFSFLAGIFCLVAFDEPNIMGYIAGLISAFIWSIYQIPQALKIVYEKSTTGFSFGFATIIAVGVLFELVSAIILQLPLPTIISSIRSLIAYVIFCILFFTYRKS